MFCILCVKALDKFVLYVPQMLEKPEGSIKNGQPETQTTLGTEARQTKQKQTQDWKLKR